MQWEELMRQFADLVGCALAKRWVALRLASSKQRTPRINESFARETAMPLDKESVPVHRYSSSNSTGLCAYENTRRWTSIVALRHGLCPVSASRRPIG